MLCTECSDLNDGILSKLIYQKVEYGIHYKKFIGRLLVIFCVYLLLKYKMEKITYKGVFLNVVKI